MSKNDIIILDAFLADYKSRLSQLIKDDKVFELFSAEQILKQHAPNDAEIEYGNIGGGDDAGIDSAYLYVNDEFIYEDADFSAYKRNPELIFYIIQSKQEASFRENVFEKLITSLKDLFDLSVDLQKIRSSYNEKIITIFSTFRKAYEDLQVKFPRVHIRVHYASKGDAPHEKVIRKSEHLKNDILGYFSDAQVEIEFTGARELIDLARTQPKTTSILQLAETPIMPEDDFLGESTAIVALATLNEYYKFITDENGVLLKSIFETNVRDYQGKTSVNKSIAASLECPENSDFWWLNNGVTILATNASITQKKLSVECPEIVNGLQTSTEIYEYIKSCDNPTREKRKLLVRIIVPHDDAVRDRIILATNSQTSIPPASLRSTDSIHRDIEEFLYRHGLFYERRKNFYKNQGKDPKKIVGIAKMAQSVISILLQEPNQARARPSSLISKDDAYEKIFSKMYNIKLYLKCISIVLAVEAYQARNDSNLSYSDRVNIKFYIALVLPLLISPVIQASSFSRVSHEKLSELELETLTEDILLEAEKIAYEAYLSCGSNDGAAKSSDMKEKTLALVAARMGKM